VGGAYLDDRTPAISSPGFISTWILTDFFLRWSSALSVSSTLELWPFGFMADLTADGSSENRVSSGRAGFIADLTGEAGRILPFGFSARGVGGVGGRTWAYRELRMPEDL
jgi:hypothetical protein